MKDCNCGAQDGHEHRPHKKDCAVFDDLDTQEQVEEAFPDDRNPYLDDMMRDFDPGEWNWNC